MNMGKINNLIERLPETVSCEMVFSKESGNCHYAFSDMVLNLAVIDTAGIADFKLAVEAVCKEVIGKAKLFKELLDGYMLIFFNKFPEFERKDVILSGVPNLSEVQLPYFVYPAQKKEENEE